MAILHAKVCLADDDVFADWRAPRTAFAAQPQSAEAAYQLIKDELLDEGSARLNLATFCQTTMEPLASQLMAESFAKNAIDKSEYPQTTELEQRCITMLANLWHADPNEQPLGTSTIGSSEACMLAGLAMKFRWLDQAEQRGQTTTGVKLNLVISSAYQVCWEKFCVYWDIELRTIPLTPTQLSLDVSRLAEFVDEQTIGIVGILGITYTGKYDDIAALDRFASAYNETHDHQLVIHVDAASGGLYTPFVEPTYVWDFQLPNVVSINVSGHKYGLVYPGIGWNIWRDARYIPQKLIFNVSYLGGEMPTMGINFSHSASHVIGQYYNFIRYGFEGYREVHLRTQAVAQFIAAAIEQTGLFTLYNDGSQLPIVCWRLNEEANTPWDLYDLADRLRVHGWQVPAYPLPAALETIIIQRSVVRADLSYDLATLFVRDFQQAIQELQAAHYFVSGHNETPTKPSGFTH